ncbi:MAG: thioesterase family protein [Actinomycetota bacterium]|nr:thioesterase family protein [Actinomycetota bacterium]
MTVFDIEVAKRFKDLDPYDHVSNAVVVDYLMEARVRAFRLLNLEDRGIIGQVVARQEINYRRPILFGLEPLVVKTWISHVGRSSFSMESEVWDEGHLAADAKTVMVCFDVQSRESREIPGEFRRVLEANLHASS